MLSGVVLMKTGPNIGGNLDMIRTNNVVFARERKVLEDIMNPKGPSTQ